MSKYNIYNPLYYSLPSIPETKNPTDEVGLGIKSNIHVERVPKKRVPKLVLYEYN